MLESRLANQNVPKRRVVSKRSDPRIVSITVVMDECHPGVSSRIALLANMQVSYIQRPGVVRHQCLLKNQVRACRHQCTLRLHERRLRERDLDERRACGSHAVPRFGCLKPKCRRLHLCGGRDNLSLRRLIAEKRATHVESRRLDLIAKREARRSRVRPERVAAQSIPHHDPRSGTEIPIPTDPPRA